MLQHRSIKLKAEKTLNEPFDEDESRRKHDQDLEDSTNEHFKELKSVSSKRPSEAEVAAIYMFPF